MTVNDRLPAFDRRMEMLHYLLKEKETTVENLSEHFSVCWRTAYNDVVSLSRYAPIYTKIGIGGGIFVLEDCQERYLIYLSREEEQLLLDLKEESVEEKRKMLLEGIIRRFSMPKINT